MNRLLTNSNVFSPMDAGENRMRLQAYLQGVEVDQTKTVQHGRHPARQRVKNALQVSHRLEIARLKALHQAGGLAGHGCGNQPHGQDDHHHHDTQCHQCRQRGPAP